MNVFLFKNDINITKEFDVTDYNPHFYISNKLLYLIN